MLDQYRKIEEVISLYILHDDLVDYYVEGISDVGVFSNFIEYKGLSINIKEISDIEFSEVADKYKSLSLTSNKNKLVILAGYLADNNINADIKCIIDKDFDGIMKEMEVNKYLLRTDFSCVEAYFFQENFLKRFLTIGVSNFTFNYEKILSEFPKVLKKLFLFRLAKEVYELNYTQLKIDNNITINKLNGVIGFSINDYVRKFLIANGKHALLDDVLKFITKYDIELDGDIRHYIQGHDFVELFYFYVNKIKNEYNYKLDSFEKALFLCFQPHSFERYPLFQSLS